MKLVFIGADHEVTGSCHYMEVGDKKFCVDIGMEQGQDLFENQEIPVNPSEIDFILLTHAHIDHTGLLPMLFARGFRGQVYATKATVDLSQIMLRDSAHIQQFEAEWRNRKARRSGGEIYEPLYTMEDALGAIRLLVPCEYDKKVTICDEVTIRFTDVGHLLGSSSIEVFAKEGEEERTVVFSGDLGNTHKPILRDPIYTKAADYVVMESTYGNRSHNGTPDYVKELVSVFKRTFDRGGNVVIPSFAVGRTQELLYHIRKIKAEHLIDRDFDVYVDSPLAIEATEIFSRNVEQCFDDEAIELVREGINPLSFPGLKYAVSSEESKMINFDPKPKVIISASGMCEAGRIRHHLKHNLWRAECTVLFVGYQANGTTGRIIIDGIDEIKLFGEPIQVKAEIAQLPGSSGHADKDELIRWVSAFKNKPQKVFVVHGEDSVCEEFTECLKKEHGFDAYAPYTGGAFDLVTGCMITEGNKERKSRRTTINKRNRSIYDRLVAAGRRLMTVIMHNEGGANKDLAKFTDQINSLCDKWDR